MQLEFRNIHKQFGTLTALDAITAQLPPFQTLAFIGPSGGGKTTLLRIIAGLEIPCHGELIIDGRRLAFDETNLLQHRRSVGTVFQAYNLFPHLTAFENVMLPLEKVHGLSPVEARTVASELLERFQLLEHAARHPAELSGGQQQRVAIVRAIAIKPRFLLFDEPTSALDPEMTAEVLALIEELRNEGRNQIIVTHNMGFARHVADYCIFIAAGRIVETGPSDDLFTAPQTRQLKSFLDTVLRY